jgi:hypothetical protein
MKPKTAATGIVLLLLAASGFCLGARRFADSRHSSADPDASSRSTADPVMDRTASAGDRPGPSSASSRAEALFKRLHAIFSIVNPAERTRTLLELSSHFQPEDWAVAMESFDRLDLAQSVPEYGMLLSAWTEKDPLAAMGWALARHDPKAPEAMVIQTWLVSDREAALTWLLTPGRINEATRLLTGSALGALSNDLPDFTRVLTAVPEDLASYILSHSKMALGNVPYETLHTWLDTLDSGLRRKVLSEILEDLPQPQQQIALLHDYPDELPVGSYELPYLYWTKTDEAAAVASLGGLDPGPGQVSAWRGVLRGLIYRDELPVVVEAMHAYPERLDDSFLSVAVITCGNRHSDQIMEMISLVQDPAIRLDLYRHALPRWQMLKYPASQEAYQNWISTHDIPEQLRRELEEK